MIPQTCDVTSGGTECCQTGVFCLFSKDETKCGLLLFIVIQLLTAFGESACTQSMQEICFIGVQVTVEIPHRDH